MSMSNDPSELASTTVVSMSLKLPWLFNRRINNLIKVTGVHVVTVRISLTCS